jgi:hypothetical protein
MRDILRQGVEGLPSMIPREILDVSRQKMATYEFACPTKRCARTQRPLQPGERYMAALFQRDGELIREDVSLEAWNAPPQEAFAWWQTRVPADEPARPAVIDDGLVYDCFTRLDGEMEPQKANFRYVLALWLMRKRRLKFEELRREDGCDWLLLRESKAKRVHKVLDPHLTEEAIAQVQEEVETMLRTQ